MQWQQLKKSNSSSFDTFNVLRNRFNRTEKYVGGIIMNKYRGVYCEQPPELTFTRFVGNFQLIDFGLGVTQSDLTSTDVTQTSLDPASDM